MIRVAVIDDYTSDAVKLTNWEQLKDKISVDFFQDHLLNAKYLKQKVAFHHCKN